MCFSISSRFPFLAINIFSFFLISCENTNPYKLDNNLHRIDTLMILSDSEVIDLGDDGEFLTYSDFSSDGTRFFIFDLENRYLYTINIKDEKLEKKLMLEKEGPNGIGDWIVDFKVINDSNYIAQGNNNLIFFNYIGEVQNKLSMDHLFYLHDSLLGKFMNMGFLYKNKQVYVPTAGFNSIDSKIIQYDPKSDKFELMEIPFLNLIKSWSVLTTVDKFKFFSSPSFIINDFPQGFLVFNRGLPNMVAYLDNGDTIQTKPNMSKFYNDVEPTESIIQVHGEEEDKEFKMELQKRMNFLRPVIDSEGNRVFRMGYKLSTENNSFDNYLFVYDLNLNLIMEEKLDEITIKPKKLFLLGSKFYLAASFDDELGFLVFDIPKGK